MVEDHRKKNLDDDDEKKKERDQAREDYKPLNNKEAEELAEKLGYKRDKNPPFNTQNKPAFRKGNDWITLDRKRTQGRRLEKIPWSM